MMKYVMMIVLVAMLAVSNLVAAMAAKGAGTEIPGICQGKLPLDKTWTTGGQENEAGSQVLAISSLTSHVSFKAEGKGFEPSTGCPAPDFESAQKREIPAENEGFGQVVSILGSSQNDRVSYDPDLALIVGSWADLPAAIRAGIVAMVRAASDG